jgi:hypothetical protein
MALSKLFGRGVGAATRRGAPTAGKNRLMADLSDDVVSETKSDLAQMRKALSARAAEAEDDKPGAALRRISVQEAGGRAALRTGSRAGAVGAAGAGGVALGTAASERANETRRRMMEDEEDKTPKRVAVASRTMDDDEMDTIKKRLDEEKSKREDKKEMSFKEAFAAARKDDKATFTWQGKRYTTELAKEGPKPSVREGKNENIDDETRGRAEMNKGGVVKKKYSMGGAAIPVVYAGAKKPVKSMPNPALAAKRLNKPKPPVVAKTKMAKGGAVKGKKK